MNIGNALYKVRKSKGYRQNLVSEKTGITQTYLSLIENNQKVPSIGVIQDLCRFYKIPFAIMMWHTISEGDVAKDKQFAFKKLKPSIDALITEFF